MVPHHPINLQNVNVIYPDKCCFEGFSTQIHFGQRIALIGDNGCGKTSLLTLLSGCASANSRQITLPANVTCAFMRGCFADLSLSVWQVASELVKEQFADLEALAQLANQLENNATLIEQYDQLLEKINSEGSFFLEVEARKLLTQFDLLPLIHNPIRSLSGGEKGRLSLVRALIAKPNVLLLDEPTNHLDSKARENLIKLLQNWSGTLIFVSHDEAFLQTLAQSIWHIVDSKVQEYHGCYAAYQESYARHLQNLKLHKENLLRHQKHNIAELEKEQQRAAKSRYAGKQSTLPQMVLDKKRRQAQETAGRKSKALLAKKDAILNSINETRRVKELEPYFNMQTSLLKRKALIRVEQGIVGYAHVPLLQDIQFSLQGGERVAILGENGSGKSTFLKAIINSSTVLKAGDWWLSPTLRWGYLDQNFANVDPFLDIYQQILGVQPNWNQIQIQQHCQSFLLAEMAYKRMTPAQLSGGELARLSLACIAARSPDLLILDEITNHLDISTKNYVATILKTYPGALLLVSHDSAFIEKVGIEKRWICEKKTLREIRIVSH